MGKKHFHCELPPNKTASALVCTHKGSLLVGVGNGVYRVGKEGLHETPMLQVDSKVERLNCVGDCLICLTNTSLSLSLGEETVSVPLCASASDWCHLHTGTLTNLTPPTHTDTQTEADEMGALTDKGTLDIALACTDGTLRVYRVRPHLPLSITHTGSVKLRCTCVTGVDCEPPALVYSWEGSVGVVTKGKTSHVLTLPHHVTSVSIADVTGDGTLEMVVVSGGGLTACRLLPDFSSLPIRVPPLEGVVDILCRKGSLYVARASGCVSRLTLDCECETMCVEPEAHGIGRGPNNNISRAVVRGISTSLSGLVPVGQESDTRRLASLQESIMELEVRLNGEPETSVRETSAPDVGTASLWAPTTTSAALAATPYPSISVKVRPSLRTLSIELEVAVSTPVSAFMLLLPRAMVVTDLTPTGKWEELSQGVRVTFPVPTSVCTITVRMPDGGAGGKGQVMATPAPFTRTQLACPLLAPYRPTIMGTFHIPLLPFYTIASLSPVVQEKGVDGGGGSATAQTSARPVGYRASGPYKSGIEDIVKGLAEGGRVELPLSLLGPADIVHISYRDTEGERDEGFTKGTMIVIEAASPFVGRLVARHILDRKRGRGFTCDTHLGGIVSRIRAVPTQLVHQIGAAQADYVAATLRSDYTACGGEVGVVDVVVDRVVQVVAQTAGGTALGPSFDGVTELLQLFSELFRKRSEA
ncbi:hypothetical protein KIPB_000474 [Kipferlia bialata]|uniref:Uncharacterized protein n=1 Tax=Kipferlia bialata TaxID=797122 RepID=A0A9K3CP30_9EUKA|nr:hypothetical protein KIPB_000474 [Kipferlia bialata]|eukprot:g474.t1